MTYNQENFLVSSFFLSNASIAWTSNASSNEFIAFILAGEPHLINRILRSWRVIIQFLFIWQKAFIELFELLVEENWATGRLSTWAREIVEIKCEVGRCIWCWWQRISRPKADTFREFNIEIAIERRLPQITQERTSWILPETASWSCEDKTDSSSLT